MRAEYEVSVRARSPGQHSNNAVAVRYRSPRSAPESNFRRPARGSPHKALTARDQFVDVADMAGGRGSGWALSRTPFTGSVDPDRRALPNRFPLNRL